jgi:transcriptional regulator with XRE-family HTH domain
METLTPARLATRLAQMRAQLGQARGEEVTQRQLAQALGIKPQAYNSWEQGKALPRLDHLWRLARYYRVSLDMLCGYERNGDATDGVEWESVRRPQSTEDEQALDLFYRALAGEMEDAADGRVGLAIRHVIYSQLIRVKRAPHPDEQ